MKKHDGKTMKTLVPFLFLVVLFNLLFIQLHARVARVYLRTNEELVYEWKSNTINQSLVEFMPYGNQTIRYALHIDRVNKSQIEFSSRVLKNIVDFSQFVNGEMKDFAFPTLTKHYQNANINDILEEILFQVAFRFELNRRTNTIRLANSDEIQKQCEAILRSRNYPEKTIKQALYLLDKRVMQEKTMFYSTPFRFIKTDLYTTDTLRDNKIKLLVNFPPDGKIEINGVPNDKIAKLSYKVDPQTGLIISFCKKIEPKNIHTTPFRKDGKSRIPEFGESLELVQKAITKPKRVVVCGHINNPVSQQVILYTLNKFMGNDLDVNSATLNQSGYFHIEAKLTDQGLIALKNPNNNHNFISAPILLYASPGDSIFINTSFGERDVEIIPYFAKDHSDKMIKKYSVPYPIAFSGNRVKEAESLYKFQYSNNLPPFEIWNNTLLTNTSATDAKIVLQALKSVEQIAVDLRTSGTEKETIAWLYHELQAYLYALLFSVQIQDYSDEQIILSGVVAKPEMKDQLLNRLDTVNIHRIYNDYGIFSRDLTRACVSYKFQRLKNVNNNFLRHSRIEWGNDPELNFQFCREVLNGSALYREAAQILYNNYINSGESFFFPNRHSGSEYQWKNEVNDLFGLMIERSNDQTFVQGLKETRDNFARWNKTRHLPDVPFTDLHGEKSKLRDLVRHKTTIVFATSNWTMGYYELDNAAKKYSDFNFIHIVEGTDYSWWKKWVARANPVSQQLFFPSDSMSLKDIFLNNNGKYLVFDKSGKKIGAENDIEDAINLASDNLKQHRKEVGYSILTITVVILGLLLILSLVGFVVYKIRTNRRLKKQSQEKRLRELQMAALRAQMNPHFLFNSLNSVQNLIQQNKSKEAHLYLSDFAGLIRKVLRNSDKEEVTLSEELETLDQYLKLEKLRFDFDYTIEVDERIDRSLFMLPALILQPLAENALIHGLQHKTGDKKLQVRVEKAENAIRVIIEDNGIGLGASKNLEPNSNGIGLHMNTERIEMMKEKYGGNYSIKLYDLSEQGLEGTRVVIEIPEEQ